MREEPSSHNDELKDAWG